MLTALFMSTAIFFTYLVTIYFHQLLSFPLTLISNHLNLAPARPRGRPAKNQKMTLRGLTVTNHPAKKEAQSETYPES
jgi:hypothetical protein